LNRELAASGYTLVDDPRDATYMIQINHVRLVETELNGDQTVSDAIGNSFMAGLGGAFAADVFGIGAVAEIGLGVGVLAFLLDSSTKHVAHTLTTDVLVTERVSSGEGDPAVRSHRTQIVSGASKMNLKLEEGLPAMVGGMSRSLAGMLPTRPPENWGEGDATFTPDAEPSSDPTRTPDAQAGSSLRTP
jgi:hypothetical protein